MEKETKNDLESADTGDVFVHSDGTCWEVLGFCDQPSVLIQRVGCRHLGVTEHTRHDVIPSSLWAADWRRATTQDILNDMPERLA